MDQRVRRVGFAFGFGFAWGVMSVVGTLALLGKALVLIMQGWG